MTLLGIDTSRWEDNPNTPQTIDWQKSKDAGVKFVIMKATEGPSYIDPVFNLHAADTKGIFPRGSYHYWRVNHSASSQARNYVATASGFGLELPPCLDVEDYYGDLPKGSVLQTRLIEMLKAVDNAFGRECMLYTSPNILKYYLPSVLSPELTKRKLWIAHYGVNTPSIAPFTRWAFWQYSERGVAAKYGIDEAIMVDENFYNGTQEQFNAEFGLTPPPVDPPPGAWLELLSVTNETGTKIPQVCVVNLASADWGPLVMTIDQTPVTPPPSAAGLYRIKDDIEAGIKPNGTREYLRIGLPSTVRLQGGASSVRLTPAWMDYVYSIQGNPNYQFLSKTTFKPAVGWHNQGDPNRVEQVVFSGNVVEVMRIEDNRAYIKTAFVDAPPPAVPVMPTDGRHPLIHNFSIQYANRLDITTDGKWARTIVIANAGEQLWIDVAELVKL